MLSTKIPLWSSVMLSIICEALHFVSKELRALRESSVATKWRKRNYKHNCEVLQIKPMSEGYDDRSPETIPLKTMYLKNYKRYSFADFSIRFK